ncbi:flagellar biosynthesis anti-sigma factor FlgM [Cohnella sp. 56]|uniref:flagellar biosynthesis anti-sigma factor FlgM n=1 Tax=Cohnella sp. 56 TaxID=3113722 RepID=UPI0030EAE7A5
MKINETQRIANIRSVYANSGDHAVSGKPAAKKKDNVSISPEALELLQSQQMSEADKTKKIEQLKSAVSSGTYHVDAGKIADKLLPFIL